MSAPRPFGLVARARAWALRSWPRLVGVGGAALALLLALDADARPGGGERYSGRRSSDGGGGDGGGLLLELLFRLAIELVFRYPAVGIPLLIVLALYVLHAQRNRPNTTWSTVDARTLPSEPPPPGARPARRAEPVGSARRALAAQLDPDFSAIVFEDFVTALHARLHEDRGGDHLDRWAMYASPDARAALTMLGEVERVDAVILGALHYEGVDDLGPTRVCVRLALECNYTEHPAGGRPRTWWAVERWALERDRATPSRRPEAAQRFACPSCGAATAEARSNVCAYCGTAADTGAFDWVVTAIATVEREARPPNVEADAPEVGTSAPTRVARDLDEGLVELRAADPAFALDALEARVRLVHAELTAGWVDQEPKRIRPFVTDALFQTQLYWIDGYRRAGLVNRVDDARVERIVFAAASSDRWYDALTVRVFATGKDYKVRKADGVVVAGDRTRPRPYSEYWTLIRGRGVARPTTTTRQCPSCGAALDVGMAGDCAYCGARITSGEFDWVLSRIEQDESYVG